MCRGLVLHLWLSDPPYLYFFKLVCRGINQDPVLRLRIVIDPLNEPDSYTIRWEANATLHLPGASDLYLGVMDALYAINPATLFMIQVRLSMQTAGG